ncbi:X-ray repair cross-complementing protein 5 [Euwallacea fornicatus]|uniref:X-ray repair cross-complementing protein 5 n=1 Tax=Euwallacea fornicatus TaxID=995702 RepID=UPI00338FC8E9
MNDFEAEPEENEETTTINFKPSFVLIAIDTHPCMFKVSIDSEGNDTHPFKEAIMACYEIADSLIFATSRSNYNQFGILFVNEDQKANLIEVEDNMLESIKKLKEVSNKSLNELRVAYERTVDVDLAAFFLLCRKKFKGIKAAYYKRTLIIITNDDNPLKGDSQKKFAALNEAKTFEPCDITLELISMTSNFDYKIFYNELFHLYSKPPTSEAICKDKEGLVDKLSNLLIYRYTKIRYKLFPFKNDYDRFLKVMKVNFIREAKLYNTSKATRDGRIVIKAKQDPGARSQEQKYKLFTSTLGCIEFDLQDKYDIYSKLPLGIHLQYISDRQTNIGVVIDQVSLIVLDPKEELQDYFEQFWQYCVENNKVLICIKKYRHPFEIRYVELIPKYANEQKLFVIKDIPFCEEYLLPKCLNDTKPLAFTASKEQKIVVNSLIQELKWKYDPKMFNNMSYSKKKAYVKSKLLDLPEEDVEDPTSNITEMNEVIESIATRIEELFGFTAIPRGEKRKAGGGAASKRGKK